MKNRLIFRFCAKDFSILYTLCIDTKQRKFFNKNNSKNTIQFVNSVSISKAVNFVA